jgi:hypothetical protein
MVLGVFKVFTESEIKASAPGIDPTRSLLDVLLLKLNEHGHNCICVRQRFLLKTIQGLLVQSPLRAVISVNHLLTG